jgi:hypothetical protein
MPSNEPRVPPPAGDKTTPVAPGNGSGNGGGSNGSGNGNGTATVTVAASVENALFAVQQQLEREAEKVRLVPVPSAPAPAAAPTAPVPALRVREVRPVVVEPDYDYADEDDDYETEFWGEPARRRPTQRKIDPKLLTREERKALGKLRARKVRRIVRHVSPWSVFKFSIFFYLCVWLILMVAGVILWKLSQTAGVVTNFEKFYAKAAGEKSFEIDGRSLFRAGATAGAILVFAATAFTVLMATLFNLITDLTGGIRMTVIELESTRRTVRRRSGSDRVRARARLSDDELKRAEGSRRGRGRGARAIEATAPAGGKTSAKRSSAPAKTAPRAPEIVPEPRRRPAATKPDDAASSAASSPTTAH